jgi:hypothetical protein
MVRQREINIEGSARLLVDRFGADAPLHAAFRAQARRQRGDVEGAANWRRIEQAAAGLCRAQRSRPLIARRSGS